MRFRSRLVASLTIGMLSLPALSLAQDRRTEALARDALKKARLDFETQAYAAAAARLEKAAHACSPVRCGKVIRAALVRDQGALKFVRGDRSGADDAFAEAIALDSKTALDPAMTTPELEEAFAAAKERASVEGASPPQGDFVHTPALEQTVDTPLPIYVEYPGGSLAQVVVKYKATGATEFKRVALTSKGHAWIGTIPCADVKNGVVRYYLQGFDREGTPVALSGSPKRTFVVPIRVAIHGAPPSIPGLAPPARCDKGDACEPGAPGCDKTSDEEKSEEPSGETSAVERRAAFARFWIGISGSIDVAFLPSANDVCKLSALAAPTNGAGYYCTTPSGSDFPSRASTAENDSLAQGSAGTVRGGPAAGDIRVLLSLEYALNANALLGVRAGYVARAYPGHAAITDGRTFSPPLHFEARGTYLFGDDPLAHVGFAPMIFVAGAVSKFDASTTVTVVRSDVTGPLPMEAWRATGPWSVALGAGFRYAFSQRTAFSGALKLMEAFGGGGTSTIMAPELSVAYGF